MSLSRRTFFFWSFFFVWLGFRLLSMAISGLGDDEAYYWDWSRTLAWSYYDHPPLTAWLIRLSETLFGHNSFAVRLPAFVCTLTTAHFVFHLAREMFDEVIAQLATLLYLVTPLFSLGGILMVPDAPMGALWMMAVYVAWQIQIAKWSPRWGFPLLGLILGLGFLAKYPIVLLGLSLLILFAQNKKTRAYALGLPGLAAIALFLMAASPVFIWNWQYHWPSFTYHLSDRQSGGFEFTRWLQFLASQFLALTPFVFFYTMTSMWKCWNRRTDQKLWFLLITILPTFAVFAIQPLLAEFKPHWLAPTYPTLFIALAFFYCRDLYQKKWIRSFAVPVTIALCLLLSGLFYGGLYTPLISKIEYQINPEKYDPRNDPTNDFAGWEKLAEELKKNQRQIFDKTGERPVLTTWRYQLTGQIANATQEKVYRLGKRGDAYLFLQDLNEITGKRVLFVTDNRYELDPEKENLKNCEELPKVEFLRDGLLSHTFRIWSCLN